MLMKNKPSIVCLTDSWLNSSVGALLLHSYAINTRRDRNDRRTRVGVILFRAIGKSDVIIIIWEKRSIPFLRSQFQLSNCSQGLLGP